MVVVVRFDLSSSFENMYFLYMCLLDLYTRRYEIASGLGIDRFNQPFNSFFFNYRIKDRDRKNE